MPSDRSVLTFDFLGLVGAVTGVGSLGYTIYNNVVTEAPKLEGDATINHQSGNDGTLFKAHLELSNKSNVITTIKQMFLAAENGAGKSGYSRYPEDYPFHQIPDEFRLDPGTKSMDVNFYVNQSFPEHNVKCTIEIDQYLRQSLLSSVPLWDETSRLDIFLRNGFALISLRFLLLS